MMLFASSFTLILVVVLRLSTRVISTTPSNIDLLNPDLFTCTCDLTTACDFNCCCDTSCSSSDKALFTPNCQAYTRTLINKEIDSWYCDDIFGNLRLQEPNWFPIMCVNVSVFHLFFQHFLSNYKLLFKFYKSVTTVLLGKFYSPNDIDKLVNGAGFTANIEGLIKNSYNYRSGFISKNKIIHS